MQPDITLPRPIRIREYHALLNQSGTTAPVATVLHNTLGSDIVWTREDQGSYRGLLANTFSTTTTSVVVSWTTNVGIAARVHSDLIYLTAFFLGSGNPTDGILNASIIIRVYDI